MTYHQKIDLTGAKRQHEKFTVYAVAKTAEKTAADIKHKDLGIPTHISLIAMSPEKFLAINAGSTSKPVADRERNTVPISSDQLAQQILIGTGKPRKRRARSTILTSFTRGIGMSP